MKRGGGGKGGSNTRSKESTLGQWIKPTINNNNQNGTVNKTTSTTTTTTTTTTITNTTLNTTINPPLNTSLKQTPVVFTMEKYKELMLKLNQEIDDDLSGDEDDDLYGDEEEEDIVKGNNDSIFQNYNNTLQHHHDGGLRDSKQDTLNLIINETKRGMSSCLICLENIKTRDSLWQCSRCYCQLHLSCTQKWSRDSLSRSSEISKSKGLDPVWLCPKCRYEYHEQDYPKEYRCWCKKRIDPDFSIWLTPHSCEDLCGKSTCQFHKCVLLCHPGPCPPCPFQIKASCNCGKASRQQRCSTNTFSCEQVCDKRLECGHQCMSICHQGSCPPCTKKSFANCRCGSIQQQEMACLNRSQFQCNKICNKKLSCGNHKCKAVCCDSCNTLCLLTLPRQCGCGKKTYTNLSCAIPTPSCGSTCGRLLSCGIHRCDDRCHTGDCAPCRKYDTRPCQCGKVNERISCTVTEVKCQVKCTKVRDCGNHQCKRKCCVECPPCTEKCSEKLACGNHRCESRCHQGTCLPCTLSVKIYCACKKSFKSVPCGMERKMQPPRCNHLCQIPTTCHHHKRRRHKCHFGACPPCTRICGVDLPSVVNGSHTGCTHKCPSQCHDVIPQDINYRTKPVLEYSSPPLHSHPKEKPIQYPPKLPLDQVLNCSNCKIPVERSCKGNHMSKFMLCSNDPIYSCQDKCNNLLSCGNHYCNKECHTISISRSLLTIESGLKEVKETKKQIQKQITNSYIDNNQVEMDRNIKEDDEAIGEEEEVDQDECIKCLLPCQNERPKGCQHSCILDCHINPCPECIVPIKMRCYCSVMMLSIPCHQFQNPSSVPDRDIFSCQFPCNKVLKGCSHQCSKICHQDDCMKCISNQVVTCKCGYKKDDQWSCIDVQLEKSKRNISRRDDFRLLDCDDSCPKSKQQQKQLELQQQEQLNNNNNTMESNVKLNKLQKREIYQNRKQQHQDKYQEEEMERKRIQGSGWNYPLIIRVVGVLVILFFFALLFISTLRTPSSKPSTNKYY